MQRRVVYWVLLLLLLVWGIDEGSIGMYGSVDCIVGVLGSCLGFGYWYIHN